MELSSYIDYKAELGATLIHKDGSRQELGIISTTTNKVKHFSRRLGKVFRSLAKRFGEAVAIALLITNVHAGNLHPLAIPVAMGLVTTAGVNYMASDFASGGVTPTISGMKFHDSGTGVTAAAIGDTALQTGTGNARVSGTASNPSANIYQSVATLPYTATAAITEWGLFSASTTGTMWDHRVFSAINVVNGDSIQFTYKLTIAAGGS
jgi:hypothetical protein